MAAKKDKYDKLYDKELAAILREIDKLYSDLANEVGTIGITYSSSVHKEAPFILSKYPLIQKRIDALVKKLAKRLGTAVVNGVRSAWTLANDKNNELCNLVFGEMAKSLTADQERRYYTSNGSALDAFLQRKVRGLSLSDRVWNYAELFKEQIEATLELGIKTGESAQEMARDLKTYLRFPDKLFRRVRDKETGELHLSKAAQRFHPGQGVYRSSYKNAYRLARTETNMAYRTADHLRRTQLDFVVGIEIHLSNNHTCLGPDGKPHPFFDICDELQGKSPKWFEFRGWHPACRCFTTTILKTDDEIARDLDGIDRGSVNTVKEMPPQWGRWLEKNRDRVDMAAARGTLPYFLNDNPWAWQEGVEMPGQLKPALVRAQERHMARTPEQIADIRARWQERQIAYNDAKMVLRLADSIPDLRTAWEGNYRLGSLDQLREMYETGKFKSYANLALAARSVLDNIKEIRDEFDTLADPFRSMQEHGVAATRGVHEAVKKKLSYFDSHGDIDWKIKKLKFEIDWLDKPENQKYTTWKVAQEAYRKALAEAETEKFWSEKQLNAVKWMSLAKTVAPDLASRMRVAWKKQDDTAMKDLIAKVQEEEKWQNNAKILEQFKALPIYALLEKNNAEYTFLSDLEQAVQTRDDALFFEARNSAVQAAGRYNGLHSIAETIIKNLRNYNEDLAADALEKADKEAVLSEMERLIKEGQNAVEWAKRRITWRAYSANKPAYTLDEKNGFGYLAAMESALDSWDEPAFTGALKKLEHAIVIYNDYVAQAKMLVDRLVNAGAKEAARVLSDTVDGYILADIEKAIARAEEEAIWAELISRAKMFTEGVDRATLEGLGRKTLLKLIERDIQLHDVVSLQMDVEEAERVVKEWNDLATKAEDLAFEVSPAIGEEIGDAVTSYDKQKLEAAVKRAENYKAVFGPLKEKLDELNAKKPSLESAIQAKQDELKKKRDDLAKRRKEVKDQTQKILAMFAGSSGETITRSVYWKENEAKRLQVNEDAKALRGEEKKLEGAILRFADWDDVVTSVELAIEQEKADQAKVGIDDLQKIADEVENAAGVVNGETYEVDGIKFGPGMSYGIKFSNDDYDQSRKDGAEWFQTIDDSKKKLLPIVGDFFKNATSAEKDAALRYTGGSGYVNRPLRGYDDDWYDFKGLGQIGMNHESSNGAKDIKALTEFIGRCSYPFDMWLQRGVDDRGLMGFLGIDNLNEATVKALVGKEVVDCAFFSCGTAKGTGFPGNIVNVFAPAGTRMLYVESRSRYNGENETIIQRNTRFRITKVEYSHYSWYIDVEVVGQIK